MPSVPNSASDSLPDPFFGPAEDSPNVLAEVLALPAQALTGLPVDARFILKAPGFALKIVWTTEPVPRPDASGRVVFAAAELAALVAGALTERLWSSDLKGYCLRKLHDASFHVTEGLALGGAAPDRRAAGSLGAVLRWLDLELVGVELATVASAAGARSVAA